MIKLHQQHNSLTLNVDADIINTSSSNFDLEALRLAIIKQLNDVFHVSVGKYQLRFNVTISVLKQIRQCSHKKILFQIVDSISGNNPAEAVLKGMRIKLNKNVVQEIISHQNTRTIPHEVGHLLGWNHPHANANFESINKQAHPLEQLLTEEERQCNLMSQTWYAQKANIPPEKAMSLTEQQIQVLQEYNTQNDLNHNFHLNYFLFWKKLA